MVVATATAALMACSSGGGGHATSQAPAPPISPGQSIEASAPSEPIGVSPDGVTTRVDVPAESTEEQYAQACMAAKKWMESKGGDPTTLVEAMLKEVQTSTEPGLDDLRQHVGPAVHRPAGRGDRGGPRRIPGRLLSGLKSRVAEVGPGGG